MPPRSPTSSARTRARWCSPVPGMSTDSGIPDYRGPDGTRRVTPMQHGEFVGSGEARQRYWARSFIGWQRFTHAEPNDAHRAVADLQRRGALGAVITQNVDGLHQAAGSRDVTELHGTPRRGRLPHLRRPLRPRPAPGPDGRGQPRLRAAGRGRGARRVAGRQPDPSRRRHRPRRRARPRVPPAALHRLRRRHPQAGRRLLRRLGAARPRSTPATPSPTPRPRCSSSARRSP